MLSLCWEGDRCVRHCSYTVPHLPSHRWGTWASAAKWQRADSNPLFPRLRIKCWMVKKTYFLCIVFFLFVWHKLSYFLRLLLPGGDVGDKPRWAMGSARKPPAPIGKELTNEGRQRNRATTWPQVEVEGPPGSVLDATCSSLVKDLRNGQASHLSKVSTVQLCWKKWTPQGLEWVCLTKTELVMNHE